MHPKDTKRPRHVPKRFWRSRQCTHLINGMKSTARAALKADRRVQWLASFGILVEVTWKKGEIEFDIGIKKAASKTKHLRRPGDSGIGPTRFFHLFIHVVTEHCNALVTQEKTNAAEHYSLSSDAIWELSYISAALGMSQALEEL